MVRVYNQKRDEVPDGAVYVGRPGKFGNPFVVGVHGTRAQCIEQHAASLTPAMRATIRNELAGRDLVCNCAPLACHGDTLLNIANPFTWAQYHENGYECSSAGDQMFSPLYAKLEDGRTIEMWWQCDYKGWNPSGTDWRAYKGLPPAPGHRDKPAWPAYLALWVRWAEQHPDKLKLLRQNATDRVLTDRFCKGNPVNQAHALCVVLNRQHK